MTREFVPRERFKTWFVPFAVLGDLTSRVQEDVALSVNPRDSGVSLRLAANRFTPDV